MKKFMTLHFGFEMPDAEQMGEWNKWFESIADRMDSRGHFPGGREIFHDGTKELPFEKDSITGYCIINAEDLDEAEAIAKSCPIVASTRVYEIMSG